VEYTGQTLHLYGHGRYGVDFRILNFHSKKLNVDISKTILIYLVFICHQRSLYDGYLFDKSICMSLIKSQSLV
jgi:hypothetical protein